jgi:hypothetical protein
MKQLALLGASGHGKVVADAALAAGWQVVVFLEEKISSIFYLIMECMSL